MFVYFLNLLWKVCLNFFNSIYSVFNLRWMQMMCQVIGLWLSAYPPFSFKRFTKLTTYIIQFSSVVQLCRTLCARPPCPSPTLGVYPNPCPLSWWCHPTTSSSVVPFSHLQSFLASGSFQMSQLFPSGGP